MAYRNRILTVVASAALVVLLAGCPVYYTLTIATVGQGTVTLDPPGGTYTGGTILTLTAVPASGWSFDHWEGGALSVLTGSTLNPASGPVRANRTVTAVFVQTPLPVYTLTVNVTGQGTVGVSPIASTYPAGTIVSLSAIPASGWKFDHWEGGLGGTIDPVPIAMNADTTVTAVFVAANTLTTSVVNGHGTLTPATGLQATGTTVSLTATPDTGYTVKKWTGTDNDTSTTNTNTVKMSADQTVTVEFTLLQLTLTYTAGANGMIHGTTPQTVNYGASGTAVTAVPSRGYRLVSWSDNSTQNPRTDANVTANVSVTASFSVGGALGTFSGHTDVVNSVAFSPDGTKVLTGSADKTAKLWDAGTGAVLQTFTGHTQGVESVAFSPDGTNVLTGSDDKAAKLWDATTGNVLQTFTGHVTRVTSVAFSPDGTNVLTGSIDQTAKLWDATDGTVLKTFTDSNAVYAVAWSPDGTKVLTGNGNAIAKLWDVTTDAVVETFTGNANDVVTSVAFSPDGAKVLTGGEDETAKLWDAATGKLLQTFTGHSNAVWSVAFSPDGAKVLTGSIDYTAKLWDAATGADLLTLTGHSNAVLSVTYSPDGTKALTGSADKTAMLWFLSPTPSGTTPYLLGKTQVGATEAITGAGLVLGTVTQDHSATVPTGDVISQDPAPLTSASPGTAVNLVISQGP